MQHMHCKIPLLFDCWANPVVHLLLLKSSMARYNDKNLPLGTYQLTIMLTLTSEGSLSNDLQLYITTLPIVELQAIL